jgi:mannan endo-1,4-beta-mannosidase
MKARGGRRRYLIAVSVLALSAIGSVFYLSPPSSPLPMAGPLAAATVTRTAHVVVTPPGATTTAPAAKVNGPTSTAPAGSTPDVGGGAMGVLAPKRTTQPKKPTRGHGANGVKLCEDYPYQQDAQAAYLANISDPVGLDGAPGAFNGDGLACTDQPVDPARPLSTPVGAYVAPTPSAPTKQSLINPAKKYYGLTIEGAPFATSELDAVNNEVGKTPAMIQFFTNWNQTPSAQAAGYSGAFRADGVKDAWARGALPVITWQGMDSGFVPTVGQSRGDQPAYRLKTITSGTYDAYIRQFAIDIVKTNLPVVIRFDQEMNGDFYAWNEHANGNARGDFAPMWRHVWDIFQSVGANDDVIWAWVPNRVDKLGAGNDSFTVFDRYYPGDQYVDWIGMDGYWRYPTTATDWAFTFGKTMALLKRVSSTKPIFLAEIGALQADPTTGQDLSAQKIQWMQNTFQGVLADPQIIAIAWFDNIAQQVSGTTVISNDWRMDASPNVLAAFKALVNDPRFAGGLQPDDF